jgi:uncharacterized membrane protein
MNRVDLRHIPLKTPDRFSGLWKAVSPVALGSFLLAFGLMCARLCLPNNFPSHSRWPEGLLLGLASSATLAWLTRQLPGQNVLLASLLLLMADAAVESLNSLLGIPFGPCVFDERIGRQLFSAVPWPVPLIWLVALLNSRGVARLILRPWRQGRNYGWWLLGLSVSLTILFDFGLQPFAATVEHYWSWKPTKLPTDWYGAPWINFLGRGVTTLVLLVFMTPALINKKPVPLAPSYYPLVLWLSLSGLFVTGAVTHHLWAAVALSGIGALLTTVLAVRGRRDQREATKV